jgi:hypothetical protein
VVSTALTAGQISGAVACLAANAFVPSAWWLVQMLATVHARVTEFDGAAAAELLYAAAQLCGSSGSRLPSTKWVQDFSARFWDALAAAAGQQHQGAAAAAPAAGAGRRPAAAAAGARGLSGQQLAQGLWGSLAVGFQPSDAQWADWEGAAGGLQWALPLEGAQQAVLAYKQAGRIMPRQLGQRLQAEQQAAQAARRAEVEAATAARTAAAAQLRAQQQRMRAAAATVAAHQQQRQQPPPEHEGSGDVRA